jgi:hypothetical protein
MADIDDEPEPQLFGARRGWSIGQRIRALDSYGLVLLLILLSLIVSTFDTGNRDTLTALAIALTRILLLGGTLAFALHTSAATPRAYVVCGGLVTASLVLSLPFEADSSTGRAVAASSAFLLIAAVLVTIVRRFGSHLVVTGSSILAAVCVYLLVGLAFAAVYGFVAAIGEGGLFAGVGDGDSVQRIYFSFVTLATVGYGDFVMGSDPGRMIAVTEALLGQVYLVTIVALLVGNLGVRRRHGRDGSGPTQAS